MMELYIALLLITLWFISTSFLLRRSSARLPPGPTGLPIFGSLFHLGTHPNRTLTELSKIYGPLMTLRFGSVTTVVASSAESAKAILQTNDQSFSDRTVPDAVASQPNHEATIAWAKGDHMWRNRRLICNTRMFNNHRLDLLQHLRHQKAAEMVSCIRKLARSRKEVDIGKVVFATTLNLISNTVFSVDLVDPDSESAQEFKDLVWTIMEDAGKPNFSDYLPVLRRLDVQGIKRHIQPAYLRLHEIFDELIDRRLESRGGSGEKKEGVDFLDVLLDQCDENGLEFTRHTIKPIIVDLFIAGSDTSAITTEWAMAELLHNPTLLQKARDEIIQTVGTQEPVKETDVNRLPYLQAIVKETMRLHPAVPLLLPHKAKNDVDLFGFTIPKDTQVLVNAWAIGRDSKDWENPTSFVPERFLGSSRDYKGRHFEYLPFGAGRRICPGIPLAVRMIHLLLASILQSNDWKLPEGTNVENMNMDEKFGVSLKKALPLVLVPICEEKV